MRWRILTTIIVISYLICELLLSGIQKEDLDVNTLRKLQRHNVNIDDMNNEDLRHQCASTSTTDMQDHTNSKNLNVDHSEPTTKLTTETPKITISAESDLNTMIKYFMESRKSQDILIKEDKSSPKSQTDITESILYSSYRHRNKPVTETNNHESEIKEEIKIDNIQEIIRMSLRDENIKPDVTNPSVIESSTNINVIKYNNDQRAKDMDNISKIIAEYINNQTTTVTSTYSPTTATINLNMDTISQHIQSFIRNNPQQAYINNDMILNTKPIEREANLKNENNAITKNNITQQSINIFRNKFDPKQIDTFNIRNTTDSETIRVKNNAIQYISDILQAGQLRIDAPFNKHGQSITQEPFISGTQQLTMHNIIQDSNNLYTKLERDNSKIKDEWRTIPSDTIKRIAETVKAMVLKDLQKDIIITTPHVTTISTTEVTTFPNKQDRGNLEKATHAIEKFMELFQQFQSVKESTITSGDTKFKMTEQKHVKQQYNGPVKIMYPSIITPVNPYGIKSKLEPIPPIFINQFNQDLKVNTPISHHLEIEKQNRVLKLTEKAETPITLQTNSDEIPPLGIPISKPMKLMNQNIIVTTKHPFMKPKNDKRYQEYIQRLGPNRNKPNNEMRNESPKTYAKFTNLAQEPRGFPHYDYRDRGDDIFVNIGRERAKYKDHYNDKMRPKSHYTPHYDRSDYERMHVRNQQVKRFHERLERVDDRTWNSREGKPDDEGEDTYKYKVASRQQLSLNDAKSRSRYDDTHFRNFLKTQQKVNDMLERILATKTKSQGPSVEIP